VARQALRAGAPNVVLVIWVIGGAALTLVASATMKRARQ
jgi:hypothetical protein